MLVKKYVGYSVSHAGGGEEYFYDAEVEIYIDEPGNGSDEANKVKSALVSKYNSITATVSINYIANERQNTYTVPAFTKNGKKIPKQLYFVEDKLYFIGGDGSVAYKEIFDVYTTKLSVWYGFSGSGDKRYPQDKCYPTKEELLKSL